MWNQAFMPLLSQQGNDDGVSAVVAKAVHAFAMHAIQSSEPAPGDPIQLQGTSVHSPVGIFCIALLLNKVNELAPAFRPLLNGIDWASIKNFDAFMESGVLERNRCVLAGSTWGMSTDIVAEKPGKFKVFRAAHVDPTAIAQALGLDVSRLPALLAAATDAAVHYIRFRGDWVIPFDATVQSSFTAINGVARIVPMMKTTLDESRACLYSTSTIRMASIPFKDDSKCFLDVILPVSALVLPPDALRNYPQWVASTRAVETLIVTMPKVSLETKMDLSPIATRPDVLVVQTATVQWDEHGCTAEAVTTAMLFGLSMPKPEETFVVDRPFWFVIRRSGLSLFVGSVTFVE